MFDDPVRLKTLAWLVPDARAAFEALIARATALGLHPSIVSAVRTCSEETNLASNRSGKVKRSWHVLGRAVDIELHAGAPADDPAKHYRELAAWWEEQGGTWGGRWETSFQPFPGVTTDVMHFQWTPGLGDAPSHSVWPDGLTCEQVDALQAQVLGSAPRSRVPPSSPAPSSPPRSSPQKKTVPSPMVGLAFLYWGRALQARLRSLSGRAAFGGLEL